ERPLRGAARRRQDVRDPRAHADAGGAAGPGALHPDPPLRHRPAGADRDAAAELRRRLRGAPARRDRAEREPQPPRGAGGAPRARDLTGSRRSGPRWAPVAGRMNSLQRRHGARLRGLRKGQLLVRRSGVGAGRPGVPVAAASAARNGARPGDPSPEPRVPGRPPYHPPFPKKLSWSFRTARSTCPSSTTKVRLMLEAPWEISATLT